MTHDFCTKSPVDLIRRLADAGWSQEQIACEVGVSQATVSRIAQGVHRDPSYLVVDKLRALCVDLEQI